MGAPGAESVEAEELGAGVEEPLFLPVEEEDRFLFVLSFVISLVRSLYSWDRPGRRAKESLQRAAIARTAAGKRSIVRRHSLYRLNASIK
jgi:hypothetical protein